MGKLHTHFGGAAHASALQDYLHFVRNDKHVDMLLTKEERERMLEFENERIKNREVVEILMILFLFLRGMALLFVVPSLLTIMTVETFVKLLT